VEVVGRYSKHADLWKTVQNVQRLLANQTSQSSENAPAPPRIHKIERRLDPAVIARLVADYEAGTPTTQLTTRYHLGEGTVLRLLHSHDATLRHQPLTDEEIAKAIQLYEQGNSLATVGQHFGREATVIRDVLKRAGIPRRDSHGRER
jgi:hypothetical protein